MQLLLLHTWWSIIIWVYQRLYPIVDRKEKLLILTLDLLGSCNCLRNNYNSRPKWAKCNWTGVIKSRWIRLRWGKVIKSRCFRRQWAKRKVRVRRIMQVCWKLITKYRLLRLFMGRRFLRWGNKKQTLSRISLRALMRFLIRITWLIKII